MTMMFSVFDFLQQEDDPAETRVYWGDADVIRPIYNAIWRASRKGNTSLHSIWSDKARFNPDRVYGLAISPNGEVDILSKEAVWAIWERPADQIKEVYSYHG